MYKNLYIIGNGFDKHHGLKTGYGDFRKWLKEYRSDFYNHCILLYGDNEDEWWSQFEYHLADINVHDYVSFLGGCTRQGVKQIFSELYDGITKDISFLDNGELDRLSQNEVIALLKYDLERFIPYIVAYIRDFLDEVPNPAPSKLPLTFDDESFYFTFNYTTVLEDVYGVAKQNVCHIHGNLDVWADIILGHNKTIQDILLQNDDVKNVDKETFNFIAEHRKDVTGQIIRHSNVFNQLHQIENVVIIGYSFSDIDNPYLEYIVNNLECPLKTIIFTYHSIDDRRNAVSFLDKNGLFDDDRVRFKYL